MYRCAPSDAPKPDIRQSSYRKVTPFLLHYQQAGLLQLTAKDGVYSVSSFERKHSLYSTPLVKMEDPEEFRKFVRHGAAALEPEPLQLVDKLRGPPGAKLKISRLYKMPKNLRSIIGAVQGEFGDYLTNTEVGNI